MKYLSEFFRELGRRLDFLLHRAQFERDLDEEMRHHLAMKAEEAGAPSERENRLAAERAFGNVMLLKEDSRSMWTWTLAEQLAQDIRYALRAMKRNPMFTAMAALSLALGIGANTAIYSFMDAVLLRSLPVQHPRGLVVINWRSSQNVPVIHGQTGSRYRDGKTGTASPNYPFAFYEQLHANGGPLKDVIGYASSPQLTTVAGEYSAINDGLYVDGSFYNALGVNPAVGRLIVDEDDRAGAPPVAVMSYKLWQGHFASDRGIIGRTIQINNIAVTVIGVSQQGFYGLQPGWEPAVFLPLHTLPVFAQNSEREAKRFIDKNYYWIQMMGRLKPGVTITQAEPALAAQYHSFAEGTATTDKERAALPTLFLQDGSTGVDSLRRQYSQPIYILMTMVGMILLIACANIANLLLARAAARRREIAVRLSLGAGRLRIIRQLLTESVMLALLGGVLGLAVGYWGIQGITWLLANGREDFSLHAALNWPVLGFTLALSVVTGVVFGLAPAIQATNVNLSPALKEARGGAPGRTGLLGRYLNPSRLLVVAQMALSLLLVVGAGMFVHTLANLQAVNLGFNRENVLVFTLNARQAGYIDSAAAAKFYTDLKDRLQRVPGVRSAAMSSFPLATYHWNSWGLVLPGVPAKEGEDRDLGMLSVDQNFLATMGIPVILGRGIEERDMAIGKVTVVNEQFAQRYFPGQNPIGRLIGFGEEGKTPADIEIVGIAKNAHYNSIKEEKIPPVAYIPFTQRPPISRMTYELRTAGDPLSFAGQVRQAVKEADGHVPIMDVNTQAREIDQTFSQERTFANLCSGLALLALAIACVGLYGTMAYSVSRRTSEIGIRMALGAGRSTVIWMVLREVCAMAVVGLAIGLAAAWQTSHLIKAFLFGTTTNDPLAIGLAVAVLSTAALIAGYAPARRASRIDPLTALRHE